MGEFVEVGKPADIPKGESKVVDVNGQMIAIFHVEGKFFALNNTCAHQGGPLGEGLVEGKQVTCPWHGWEYNVSSGQCKNNPGQQVDSYPVKIEDGKLFVALD